ncbi:MAG UNVERIFIED_CONTAM: replication initiation protein [Anaerolineae bacterium]|jgi:ABC-type molybdate transport system substrate-binding protein
MSTILLIVVLALGCSSQQALPAITPTTNVEKITLYTSPAMQPLLTYLVGEFTRQYALLQFEVLSLPSDTLLEHLEQPTIELLPHQFIAQ